MKRQRSGQRLLVLIKVKGVEDIIKDKLSLVLKLHTPKTKIKKSTSQLIRMKKENATIDNAPLLPRGTSETLTLGCINSTIENPKNTRKLYSPQKLRYLLCLRKSRDLSSHRKSNLIRIWQNLMQEFKKLKINAILSNKSALRSSKVAKLLAANSHTEKHWAQKSKKLKKQNKSRVRSLMKLRASPSSFKGLRKRSVIF